MDDRAAEIAEAGQRHVPLPVELEDAGDLGGQVLRIVALALLAEPAEVREIAADLRGSDTDVVGELVRRDGDDAALSEIAQRADVNRETTDDDIGNRVLRGDRLRVSGEG